MIHWLFAYGTLLPGQSRWQFLSPFVVDEGRPATVDGTLYDTGLGYPAAVFDGPGRVHGRVFRLHPSGIDESLAAIDVVEHTADQYYRRVIVTARDDDTAEGIAVWAYEYTGPTSFTPIAVGNWLTHLTR